MKFTHGFGWAVSANQNAHKLTSKQIGLILLFAFPVMLGCSALGLGNRDGGGGSAGDIAPLEVTVTYDQLEHCVSGDMSITATIANLDQVLLEGATLGLDQTTATMDWVIFQSPPGGGEVIQPGSTGLTNSYSDTFAAGETVGTGQARARVELIMEDENGQNRRIVAQGESDSKSFEVRQCVSLNLEYAGIYDLQGARVAEEITSTSPIALTGPPEGPFSGQGTLNLEAELFFESADGECFVDPPWVGTSEVTVTAELDENKQALIVNFNFDQGTGEGGVITCIVDGQEFTPPAQPGVYNPNQWSLEALEIPLSGDSVVRSIPSGFFGGIGDGAVRVSIQNQQ